MGTDMRDMPEDAERDAGKKVWSAPTLSQLSIHETAGKAFNATEDSIFGIGEGPPS